MFSRSLLWGTIILCATAGRALAGHAQAELLSDVTAVEPGKPFWLGVRLTIDPGWHVYWKNPGDAGLPTRVKFTLPDGFTAGAIEFPTPFRFEQPGNIVAFGYENSVLLLAKINPPATLPANFQGQFGADVSWLVCSSICVPGKASLSLNLGTSQPEPANQDLFHEWTARLPVSAANNPEVKSINFSHDGKISVRIIWTHAAPDPADFFPVAPDDYNIVDTEVKSSQETMVISFTAQPLAGRNPGAMTMEAVLGYANKDGQRRGLSLSIALPATDRR